jgi:branched-chain amino acid transport system ATP-binding protein
MKQVLTIDNLVRRFGGLTAVDQVSFSVPEGEIVAIIGPNGAGKTTLFNLISGFLAPDEGEVVLDGVPITRLSPDRIAQRGLVRTFQLVRLFKDMSVLSNVMVGNHLRGNGGIWAAIFPPPWVRRQERELRAEAQSILELAGIGGLANNSAANLTYGQQRLLELARALAAHPRILLLDEPAAGLNAIETEELASLVRTIRDRGTTILLIEHDMDMVMAIAQKLVVLDFGRKIAEGDPDHIQKHPAVLEAYLGISDGATDV